MLEDQTGCRARVVLDLQSMLAGHRRRKYVVALGEALLLQCFSAASLSNEEAGLSPLSKDSNSSVCAAPLGTRISKGVSVVTVYLSKT